MWLRMRQLTNRIKLAESGLDRMRAAGAIVSSTEMMIYELLRSSGAPAFREMLPYLKG